MTPIWTNTPALLLVDGMNLLWRAAFGFPARIRGRSGQDVTGLFGFFALLRKRINELGADVECVVCFDSEQSWSSRTAVFAEYKANRQEVDYGPMAWLPSIYRGLESCGIAHLEAGDSEADDLIASLARAASRDDRASVILSADRDFLQLIDGHTTVIRPMPRGGTRLMTQWEVVARYQVVPRQWCDYVALVGDRSDGIPGVRGFGPVRAAQMLAGGAQLQDLPRLGRLVGPWGRRLADDLERALVWRSLVRLKTNVAVTSELTGVATPPLPLAARVLNVLGAW